jgi:hypothetical protein
MLILPTPPSSLPFSTPFLLYTRRSRHHHGYRVLLRPRGPLEGAQGEEGQGREARSRHRRPDEGEEATGEAGQEGCQAGGVDLTGLSSLLPPSSLFPLRPRPFVVLSHLHSHLRYLFLPFSIV